MIDRRTQVMSWLEGLAQDDWPMYHSDSEVQEIAKAALALMEEQPEIVKCKNCKHGEPCNEDIYCTKDIGTIESSVHKPEWFCADGERR